jgi:dTDP-4-amino-4,6-dideoxygalactose transaminase
MIKVKEVIRLSKSCIGEAEKAAVMAVLDRGYLGMGAEVQQFEEALTDFFGRPAVCVVNGTSALQLALQACGIGPGDEVLVPSLTFVASFQAISATGAKPIACEVDKDSLLLDLADAATRLTSRTRVIMPVHYTGGVGDLEGIYIFARKNGLRVVEDAAHAFGTIYKNQRVGGFGDIACFSFDGIKNITSGEGGCIVSDDEEVLRLVKDSRLLGVEKDTEKRYSGQRSWEFDVTFQGWRYHMSNIMAAIGLEQLSRFNEFASVRQKYAFLYDSLLKDHPLIVTIQRDYNMVVPHIYVIRIPGLKERKILQDELLEYGIQTGIHYQPNHILTLYKDRDIEKFPVTISVASEILTLPLHPDLSESDIKYVIATLTKLTSKSL